tara:strand:+ start:1712 stop:1912 length:201 start_codon:yes stop_codon:yes gene_type:complete
MDSQSVALIIGAVFGGMASIIYSFKHIRESECMGSRCVQDTEAVVIAEPIIITEDHNHTTKNQTDV